MDDFKKNYPKIVNEVRDWFINKSTIDELHKSYFFNEKVGAIGSMSISNQYLIQEAGAFTFKSGTCWNYGRGDNPN